MFGIVRPPTVLQGAHMKQFWLLRRYMKQRRIRRELLAAEMCHVMYVSLCIYLYLYLNTKYNYGILHIFQVRWRVELSSCRCKPNTKGSWNHCSSLRSSRDEAVANHQIPGVQGSNHFNQKRRESS